MPGERRPSQRGPVRPLEATSNRLVDVEPRSRRGRVTIAAAAVACVVALAVAALVSRDDDGAGGGGGSEGDEVPGESAAADEVAGGSLRLGAEQLPQCLNPVTSCGDAAWTHWAVAEHVLPKLMELSPAGSPAPSPLLAGPPELAGEGTGGTEPFSVTYRLRRDADWSTGEPITCTDLAFTWQAALDTAGSVLSSSYEHVTSVEELDDDPKACRIEFDQPVAAWAELMGSTAQYVLSAANSAVGAAFDISSPDAAPMDMANELLDDVPYSGAPWRLESFSLTQAVLVRNDDYWEAERVPLLDQVTMVARGSTDSEVEALVAGDVAAIYPQPVSGTIEELQAADTVEFDLDAGPTYEGLWFNQRSATNPDGPLEDVAVREALLFAIDRDEIVAQIMEPSFPETRSLNCGGWVPTIGDWCDEADFADVSYDPARVEELLTGAGWVKDAEGFYARDGRRLSITWQTVEGNARREAIQDLVIPAAAELGIELVADNSDSESLFRIRLPQLETEMALYAQVAIPDPGVTQLFHCDRIPTEANEFEGQNSVAWCNEQASELMEQSDRTVDPVARLGLVQQIGDLVRQDAVWMPLFQLPVLTAWDGARVDGPVGDYTRSPLSGFYNLYDWFIPAG